MARGLRWWQAGKGTDACRKLRLERQPQSLIIATEGLQPLTQKSGYVSSAQGSEPGFNKPPVRIRKLKLLPGGGRGGSLGEELQAEKLT